MGIELDKVYDTMLAECIIYCGYDSFGYSLKDVLHRYLQIDLDKTVRTDFLSVESQPFTDKQIEYAAKDVEFLHKIRNLQEGQILKYDLSSTSELEMESLKALGDIEYNGMGFDSQKWLENSEASERLLMSLEEALDKVILEDSKLSSIYKPEYIQGVLSINFLSFFRIIENKLKL